MAPGAAAGRVTNTQLFSKGSHADVSHPQQTQQSSWVLLEANPPPSVLVLPQIRQEGSYKPLPTSLGMLWAPLGLFGPTAVTWAEVLLFQFFFFLFFPFPRHYWRGLLSDTRVPPCTLLTHPKELQLPAWAEEQIRLLPRGFS